MFIAKPNLIMLRQWAIQVENLKSIHQLSTKIEYEINILELKMKYLTFSRNIGEYF